MDRKLAFAALAAGFFALSAGPALAQSCSGDGCGLVKIKPNKKCAVFVPHKIGPATVRIALSTRGVQPGDVSKGSPFKPRKPGIGAKAQANQVTGGCVKDRNFSYTATKQ